MLSAVIISVGGLFQVIREVVRRGVSFHVLLQFTKMGGYVKCFLPFFVKNNESSLPLAGHWKLWNYYGFL